MTANNMFEAWINPLAFLEADKPWATPDFPPNYENILHFLCSPEIKSDLDSLVIRYKEISKEPQRLFVAPNEKHILSRLVWPLRYAKGCYMLGNYLGTIALCGMVAEMIAILLFDISNISLNNKKLEKKDEKGLFGTEFEKLGQDRRVEVLYTYGLISDNLVQNFNTIRSLRRRYLHLFSQEHSTLQIDAVKVYNAAVSIVTEIIGQDIKDGKVILKPAMLTYLKTKGLTRSSVEETNQ